MLDLVFNDKIIIVACIIVKAIYIVSRKSNLLVLYFNEITRNKYLLTFYYLIQIMMTHKINVIERETVFCNKLLFYCL